jgi:hypothetical protein
LARKNCIQQFFSELAQAAFNEADPLTPDHNVARRNHAIY